MINSDILLSVLIDDDYEKLSDLIANVTDLTFHKTSNKYKYPIFLESSEGAPLLFIAAYFGSRQCYEYLLNEQSDIPNFKYSLLTYACAGGNMSIVRDVASRFPIEFNKLGISFKGNPGFQAVRHGNLDVIKWLLLKDYKFESEEIFEACLLGYYEIFNFLFENVDYYKAKLEIYDDMIISSCLGGNDKILQKLLNEYPCKKCSKKKYQSFINYSIEKGNISCLKCLLSNSKKFFPRISESFIQPSLEYASNFEFIDIIVFLVKHGGIFMYFNDKHPSKEEFPIIVTEEGIDILTRDLQSLNDEYPILVTELGISIFVNDMHPLNILVLISVIEEGIVTFFNLIQSQKRSIPQYVTDEGIFISVKDEHFKNTLCPISVKDDGD